MPRPPLALPRPARPLQTRPYPFSDSALVPFIPPVPKTQSLILPPKGTSKLQHINTSLRMSQDPNSFHNLFDKRNNRQAVRSGSIMTVSSWTTAAKTHSTNFTGVLIGVRRRGALTSFTLRNAVLRTGVEMKYHCSSPLLRDVKVLKPADGKPGNVKKHRQSKLYYYRDVRSHLSRLCFSPSSPLDTVVLTSLPPVAHPFSPRQQPERLAVAAASFKDKRKAGGQSQAGTAFV